MCLSLCYPVKTRQDLNVNVGDCMHGALDWSIGVQGRGGVTRATEG